MDLFVRRAQSGDGAAFGRIFVEAARVAWAHFLPAEELALLDPAQAGWEERIATGLVLVAEDAGEIVAFAVVRPSPDDDAEPSHTAELDTFYALPSSWGRGVGRLLLGAALDTLRGKGFREATLWTAEHNERARCIYEIAGWQRDGAQRRKTYLGVEFIELRYRIAL